MCGVRLSLLVLVTALVWGCTDNTTGIQGKVVDGKGRPLSGVDVIAQKTPPAKGSDRLETHSGSDGSFRFKHLLPASRYTLFAISHARKTSTDVIVQTAPKGASGASPANLTVRFTSSDDGIIRDSKNELQWVASPGGSMSWVQAVRYAETLPAGGGGWRLPTREELRGLYDESTEGHADPAFRINCNWVWTSEAKNETDAWFFNFENRYEDGHCKEWILTRGRVLVVRSAR